MGDQDDFQLVVSVPHQGGLALTQTTQIPYVELLNLRKDMIAMIGDPSYVTSPCLSYQLGPNAIDEEMVTQWRADNPEAIIVSGPTNNIVGDRVIISSATQERTNVATYDWIAFYASFYNLEGESNRLAQQMQDSYDCTSDVANEIVAEQRDLGTDADGNFEGGDEYTEPIIFWTNFVEWGDLAHWSVAECPTWDSRYYCEYATHCGATVLNRPEGVGFNRTYGGSPTLYWYLNDTEAFEMGKDADIFMYSGSDWEALYAAHGEMLDQFKSVQNQQVYDTLGQGASAWSEQRYAEYDIVGLDMCDVVGHSVYQFDKEATPHERRWFRNVYTDPIGSLPQCDVAGGELTQPYVAPDIGCVRPTATAISGDTNSETSSAVTESGEGAEESGDINSETGSAVTESGEGAEESTTPPYDWDRGSTKEDSGGATVGSLSMRILSAVVAAVMMVVL